MTTTLTSTRSKSFADRFWSKVEKTASCWIWRAGCYNHPRGGKSYGCISVGSNGKHRMVAAHKAAWELECGQIPDGMKVLHSCDNPICVNPSHLFLGTQAQNVKDMISKGRAWWQAGKPYRRWKAA